MHYFITSVSLCAKYTGDDDNNIIPRAVTVCAEHCFKFFIYMLSFYRYDSSMQQVWLSLCFTDEETEVERRYAQQSRIYDLSLIHCCYHGCC